MASSITFRTTLPRTNTSSGRALWQQAQAGMNTVLSNLNRWVNWVHDDVLPEVMEEAIQPTMDLSDHYAPKDTGRMVSSRYTEVQNRNGKTTVTMGYNKNGEAPYTIFVHEMPQFFHAPPTQYKFLERAIDQDTPEVLGRIAAGMKARTGL